jgi:hypothetical protein
MFLDFSMVHSSDVGGPVSLHPQTPERASEIGVRRQLVESGMRVMLRAGLAQLDLTPGGIRYIASNEAFSFLRLLEAPYVGELRNHATWAVQNFAEMSNDRLREEIRLLTNRWAESENE